MLPKYFAPRVVECNSEVVKVCRSSAFVPVEQTSLELCAPAGNGAFGTSVWRSRAHDPLPPYARLLALTQ